MHFLAGKFWALARILEFLRAFLGISRLIGDFLTDLTRGFSALFAPELIELGQILDEPGPCLGRAAYIFNFGGPRRSNFDFGGAWIGQTGA